MCASNGDKDTAELLIELGARVNTGDANSQCPLSFAQDLGFGDLAELLARHGGMRSREDLDTRAQQWVGHSTERQQQNESVVSASDVGMAIREH